MSSCAGMGTRKSNHRLQRRESHSGQALLAAISIQAGKRLEGLLTREIGNLFVRKQLVQIVRDSDVAPG